MADTFDNPVTDAVLIGYTKYSKFRVGNLIAINGLYKGVGVIIIGEILALEHDGDTSFFEIRNLSNDSTAFVKPSAPGPFGALILYPENLGFQQNPNNRHSYSDGVTTLTGHGAQNFEVTDVASGEVLYREKQIYDILSERTRVLGIEHVHELQNLYADIFPRNPLNLSDYIRKKIDELARILRQIDVALASKKSFKSQAKVP